MQRRDDAGRPEHEWLSAEYVDHWISTDVTRDSERAPMLRRMLTLSGFAPDAELQVLDIGGGYGVVSKVVLEALPNAQVTLQDFSPAMIAQARERLAPYAGRTSFVQSDLTTPQWPESAGGPYDMAVSAIAIHNLRDPDVIAKVYAGVYRTLKPGGVFLDSDYVFAGGLESHLEWLRQAGFARVSGTI